MRRTLITLAALAAVTLPLTGCDDEPVPTAHPSLAELTAEPTPEPVSRGSIVVPLPETGASPAPVTAASPTSTTPATRSAAPVAGAHVDEAPVPAAVTPRSVPVVAEAPVEAPVAEVAPEPETPACAEGEDWQGEFGCVAVQLPGERDGRQIDGPDGRVCTVVAVEPEGEVAR